jgi:chromate reductase, NAD(P)H dehydrogenase (quinone)
MRIFAFAASLREGSFNHRLIELAAELARRAGAEVSLADFHTFDMPLYDGDLEERGLPAGALELQRGLERADGIMIAAPEYNYSISGVLKNAIDWVSRARPMPWRGKSIYLLSASPSAAGGVRGLWQTRVPLEGCGALVFPDMFSLAAAHQAFDAEGQLRDPVLAERLQREVTGFVRLAEAVAPVCSKAATPSEKKRQEVIVAALEDETELQPPST